MQNFPTTGHAWQFIYAPGKSPVHVPWPVSHILRSSTRLGCTAAGPSCPSTTNTWLWGGVVIKAIGVWEKHSPIGLGAEWAAHDCKSNGCGSPCAPGLALGLGVSSAAVRSHGNTKTPRGNLLPGAGGCGWAGARPPWVLGSRWRRRGGGAGRAHVRGRGVRVSCRCPWTLGRGPAPASAPPSTAAFCAETSRGCLLLKAAMSEASTWSWRVVALAPGKKSLRGLKTRSAEADGGWSSAARATTLNHTG